MPCGNRLPSPVTELSSPPLIPSSPLGASCTERTLLRIRTESEGWAFPQLPATVMLLPTETGPKRLQPATHRRAQQPNAPRNRDLSSGAALSASGSRGRLPGTLIAPGSKYWGKTVTRVRYHYRRRALCWERSLPQEETSAARTLHPKHTIPRHGKPLLIPPSRLPKPSRATCPQG